MGDKISRKEIAYLYLVYPVHAAESTNYHFDINYGSFEAALDRFAQVGHAFVTSTISHHTQCICNDYLRLDMQSCPALPMHVTQLHLLLQFFIAPLISEDGVEREVKAVDSECALFQLYA